MIKHINPIQAGTSSAESAEEKESTSTVVGHIFFGLFLISAFKFAFTNPGNVPEVMLEIR